MKQLNTFMERLLHFIELNAFMVKLLHFGVNLSSFWPRTVRCHFISAFAAQQKIDSVRKRSLHCCIRTATGTDRRTASACSV